VPSSLYSRRRRRFRIKGAPFSKKEHLPPSFLSLSPSHVVFLFSDDLVRHLSPFFLRGEDPPSPPEGLLFSPVTLRLPVAESTEGAPFFGQRPPFYEVSSFSYSRALAAFKSPPQKAARAPSPETLLNLPRLFLQRVFSGLRIGEKAATLSDLGIGPPSFLRYIFEKVTGTALPI